MSYDETDKPFAALMGETLTEVTGMKVGSDRVEFTAASGRTFVMYHSQDCCESVSIEDVAGNPDDLLNSPITMADESSSGDRPADVPEPEYAPESQTWTFYRFATVKGYVTLRWLGESNGYYSESVTFAETTPQSATPASRR